MGGQSERSQISREMEAGSSLVWSNEYKKGEAELQKLIDTYAKTEKQIASNQQTLEKLSGKQQRNGMLTEKQAATQRKVNDELRNNIRLQEESTRRINQQENALSKLQNRAKGADFLKSAAISFGVNRSADLVSSIAGNITQSQFGGDSGQLVSGAVSGAMAGAMLGSALGLAGSAVGGVVGGILGIVNEQLQTGLKKEKENLVNAENFFFTADGGNAAGFKRRDEQKRAFGKNEDTVFQAIWRKSGGRRSAERFAGVGLSIALQH